MQNESNIIRNNVFILSTLTQKRVSILLLKEGKILGKRIDLNYEDYINTEIIKKEIGLNIQKYTPTKIIFIHNSTSNSIKIHNKEIKQKESYKKLCESNGIESKFFVIKSNNIGNSGLPLNELEFVEY